MATLGTFTAGQVLTAAELNAIGTWTTYTPALTSTGTTPNLGTSPDQYGIYSVINDLVFVTAYVRFGASGSSAGSGDYFVSLPPVSASTSGSDGIIIGYVWLYDASLATGHSAIAQVASASTVQMYKSTGAATIAIGASNPFAWAGNDQIRMQLVYKAA